MSIDSIDADTCQLLVSLDGYTTAERLETLSLTCPPDAFLVANNQSSVPIHRTVLARYSQAFRDLYTRSGHLLARPIHFSLNLDVPREAMSLIVDLMYEGSIRLAATADDRHHHRHHHQLLASLTAIAREIGFVRGHRALLAHRFPEEIHLWERLRWEERGEDTIRDSYTRTMLDSVVTSLIESPTKNKENTVGGGGSQRSVADKEEKIAPDSAQQQSPSPPLPIVIMVHPYGWRTTPPPPLRASTNEKCADDDEPRIPLHIREHNYAASISG